MVILKILLPLIHEHGIYFHLFVLSPISFIHVLQFSEYSYFTYLGRLIPRHFILFDVMVNGVVSLISLSNSLLLVYRNETYFCILILHPATLLNSLMSSNSFLLTSLGFSVYSIMSSTDSDYFTSSFPIWIPCIFFFSCLFARARIFNNMLNNSGKNGHPCLVPDLRGNAFSFSPSSKMLAVGLSHIAFIMLRYVHSMPYCLRVFIINGC